MPSAKQDADLLKGLPKVKVSATWIPWTYSRLAYASGYGAGIESPGWYDFLFGVPQLPVSSTPDKTHASILSIRWLAKVAHLRRDEDLDASSASVIEAVRLAESIAALRGR